MPVIVRTMVLRVHRNHVLTFQPRNADMHSVSVVREPGTDPADPFGDFAAYAPELAASASPATSAPPPESDDFTPPDFGATRQNQGGGRFGGIVAAGVARIIGIGAVIAITSGGFGLFRASIGNDGPPNVAVHVLEACQDAKLALDPLGLAIGTHNAYEQAGASSRITFEGPADTTWTCVYEPGSGSARIEGLDLPG